MADLSVEEELTRIEERDQALKALISRSLKAFGVVWAQAKRFAPPAFAPWFDRVCAAELRILASTEFDDQGRDGPQEVPAWIGLRLVALQATASELIAEHIAKGQPPEAVLPLRVALMDHLHAFEAVQRAFQGGGQPSTPPGPAR